MVSGTLKARGATIPVTGRLRGDQITLEVGTARYVGRVSDNVMMGEMTGSTRGAWRAARAPSQLQN